MIYAVDFIMSGAVWAESTRNQRRCLSLLRDLHQESATPIAILTGVTLCKMVDLMQGRPARGDAYLRASLARVQSSLPKTQTPRFWLSDRVRILNG